MMHEYSYRDVDDGGSLDVCAESLTYSKVDPAVGMPSALHRSPLRLKYVRNNVRGITSPIIIHDLYKNKQ
jgi:hypothetical protein